MPRAAGFAAAVEAMGSPVIYDLTIAYDNNGKRPDEPSMLAGRFPRRVVVRVDRFTQTPRDAKKWLFERWARKEERLAAGLKGEPSAPSGAVVHVLFGAFIASLACYALCVDWRVRRVFYATSALWVGVGKVGGLDAFLLSGS